MKILSRFLRIIGIIIFDVQSHLSFNRKLFPSGFGDYQRIMPQIDVDLIEHMSELSQAILNIYFRH